MWNLEGMRVFGMYLETFPVTGIVSLSRVKYGGGVCHTVVLDNPIEVFGATRERVILDHEQVERVKDGK
jgi:hypothetical protein